LRARHQEASDRISGASSHLRNVKRPESQLEVVTTRLMDRDRPQRRLKSALDWVHTRYEAPVQEKQTKLTLKALQSSITRMSDVTIDQWEKQRAARLKALERRQQEGRLPPSAVAMRKHDASYLPPAVTSDEICSRLAPADYWMQKAKRDEAMIAKIAEESRTRSRSASVCGGHRRREPARDYQRSPAKLSQQLFENVAATERRCKLFEAYVVAHDFHTTK
jgi:hypothetical protein